MHPYYETATSPQIFEEHMNFLHQNNYHIIDVHDIVKFFNGNGDLSKKPLVISFDDGLTDFYTAAFPVLEKNAFSATMFLPTGFIGNKGLEFNGKECLSWEIVRNLHSKGVKFGSHTKNHLKLYGKKESEIDYELNRSKKRIEMEIDEPIAAFSYPYAFPEQDKEFVHRLRKALRRNGYSVGVTTRIGIASKDDDCFFLKRLPINTFDDLPFFKAKIEGAYDWIYRFQLTYKKLKASFKQKPLV